MRKFAVCLSAQEIMSNADQDEVAISGNRMSDIFVFCIFCILYFVFCILYFCIFVDEYGVQQGCYLARIRVTTESLFPFCIFYFAFCILYFAFCIFVVLLMNMALLSGENTCDNPES